MLLEDKSYKMFGEKIIAATS